MWGGGRLFKGGAYLKIQSTGGGGGAYSRGGGGGAYLRGGGAYSRKYGNCFLDGNFCDCILNVMALWSEKYSPISTPDTKSFGFDITKFNI